METYTATMWGAAIGVIAGSFVQFGVGQLFNQNRKRTQKANLKKEIGYNLSLVAGLKKESALFRNAINGDALENYFGFFLHGNGLFIQMNLLVNSGEFYNLFDEELIGEIQKLYSNLSINNQNWFYDNIKFHKDSISEGTYDKQKCVGLVDFLDKQLTETEKNLNSVLTSL